MVRFDLTNATDDERLTMCNVQDIQTAEVRVAGNFTCTLADAHRSFWLHQAPWIDPAEWRDTGNTYIYEMNSGNTNDDRSDVWIYVEFGPIPTHAGTDDSFVAVPGPEGYRNEDIEYVRFIRLDFRSDFEWEATSDRLRAIVDETVIE